MSQCLLCTGFSLCLKACFTPLCFYERPMLVPVFVNRKKSKENFHVYEIVIASSLCAISAHGRFHTHVLLSDSGGHLYTSGRQKVLCI